MKKHLFLHLSFMGLMGLSTIAYGGSTPNYTKYVTGDGKIPHGDCLEMMCQYGCVEDDTNGKYVGYCCPSLGAFGQSCSSNSVSLDICCQLGLSCIGNKCVCPSGTEWNGTKCVKCTFNNKEYAKDENVGEYGYCATPASNKIFVRNPNPCAGRVDGKTVCDTNTWTCVCPSGQVLSNGHCCPSGTPVWDARQQKCVECLTDVNACKKCVGGNWQYPASGTWVNGNACQVCDGNGNVTNVIRDTWVDANGCQQCDGNGGIINATAGSNTKEGGCCVNGVFGYNAAYCPESQTVELPSSPSCTVDWVTGHAWQYKECRMSITLPGDGTWKFSGGAKVYVGDSSKCYVGIQDGAIIQVSGGKITDYDGTDQNVEEFKAKWQLNGNEMPQKLGFHCNPPTISTKGKTITFKIKVTPHGPDNPHIHVPYAQGISGKIKSITRQ